MRRLLGALVISVLSFGLSAGCSDEEKHEFKPTDTKQFDQMKEDMIKGMMKKGVRPPAPAKTATPTPDATKTETPAK